MKTRLSVALAVLMLVTGCQNTSPTVQLTIAADALAASETVLTAADKVHLIPAADRPTVAAAVLVAQKDIESAKVNLGSGWFNSAISQVQADINTIVTLRLKYAATQPSK